MQLLFQTTHTQKIFFVLFFLKSEKSWFFLRKYIITWWHEHDYFILRQKVKKQTYIVRISTVNVQLGLSWISAKGRLFVYITRASSLEYFKKIFQRKMFYIFSFKRFAIKNTDHFTLGNMLFICYISIFGFCILRL